MLRPFDLLLCAALFAMPQAASAADPIKVAASFSILGDMVRNVGGEHVDVWTLVGPDGDAHVFEPSPADAGRLADADLVVVNGLGFEDWLDRLVEASGFSGPVTVASKGVEPFHMEDGDASDDHAPDEEAGGGHAHDEEAGHRHGAIDPHAWQAIGNARLYVANIAASLCAVDAGHCEAYTERARNYDAELAALDASIAAGFAALPDDKRVVITSHDAFGYFGRAYGVRFLAPQGVSTDAEASAADVAELIEQIRDAGVTALFVENMADARLIEQVARETGARPGGRLYSDALSAPDGPAPTYAAMMRHNADSLLAAMQGS